MTCLGYLRPCTSVALVAALFAWPANAEIPPEARSAEILVLGEQHDNPAHHIRQAAWVAATAPRALVFEMLTPEQAARGNGADRKDQKRLDAALGWSDSYWPAFDMYFPIFAAAPGAPIYGALVPRETLAAMVEQPLTAHPLASLFGLDTTPDRHEQAQREALQASAHCDALPAQMLPVMVDMQRLRDVTLADTALRALRDTGGPVVVITGNGHARPDWGMPALIARAAPDVQVFALGQTEESESISGDFTLLLDAPAPDRDDPCATFRK